MRLAILPGMTLSSVGDSEFAGFLSWIESWRHHEDLFVYMLLPRTMQKIVEEAKIKIPERVELIYEDEPMQFYLVQAEVPQSFLTLFSPLIGKYPVDVMLTSRTPAAGVLSRLLWDHRYKTDLVPIVVEESMAVDYGITSQQVCDIELIGRTLGYLVSYPVFHSQFEYDLAMSAAKRFLRPSAAFTVMEKSTIIARYLEVDRIDKVIKGVEKNEEFTLFVGQRLNETKGAADLLELYDIFYAAGRPIRIVATSPRSETFTLQRWRQGKQRGKPIANAKKATKFGEVEFKLNCGQEEFWRTGAACHAYVNMSKVEGFPIGFVEQLYCGPVGIFADVPWVRGVLGNDIVDPWPYVFKTNGEAAAILRRVYENQTEANEWAEWLRGKLREKFGKTLIVEQLYEVLEKAVASVKSPFNVSSTARELIDKAFAKIGDEFTLSELYKGVCDASIWYREGKTRAGQMSKFTLYKWLKAQGYVDLSDNAEARYRRLE